ncbi:MAG: BrnT family toxin [Campylobacterota bacterium]|nr:BrnT family toxin [Campylobacterota bacterium]
MIKYSLIIQVKKVEGEQRYALISELNGKCYFAVFILRDERFRIISVRRCRKSEKEQYYESRNNNS